MREARSIGCRTNVRIDTVCARTGRLLKRTRKHNVVVDSGLALIRDLLYGDDVGLTHGAVGTDSTPATELDNQLVNEIFRDLITTRTKIGGEGISPRLVVRFVVGSQSANGNVLREAGLFSAATGGSMIARVIPEPVTKTDAILVIYTWSIQFTRAS